MRKLLLLTTERPIRLPDRIISDGWWLIEPARPPSSEHERLRLVESDEGLGERDSGEDRREPFLAGH